MSSRTLVFALAAVALLALSESASAQYNSYRGSSDNPVGPTVSPYLNLINQGGFGTTNYQSLVRPLIEQGNAINRQGSSINQLQGQVTSGAAAAAAGGGGRGTGHASFFMNYSHFFPVAAPR